VSGWERSFGHLEDNVEVAPGADNSRLDHDRHAFGGGAEPVAARDPTVDRLVVDRERADASVAVDPEPSEGEARHRVACA
jgi:hypothetical protein